MNCRKNFPIVISKSFNSLYSFHRKTQQFLKDCLDSSWIEEPHTIMPLVLGGTEAHACHPKLCELNWEDHSFSPILVKNVPETPSQWKKVGCRGARLSSQLWQET
jgi:hypothetical protein